VDGQWHVPALFAESSPTPYLKAGDRELPRQPRPPACLPTQPWCADYWQQSLGIAGKISKLRRQTNPATLRFCVSYVTLSTINARLALGARKRRLVYCAQIFLLNHTHCVPGKIARDENAFWLLVFCQIARDRGVDLFFIDLRAWL
jgi:hypothetical protein